MRIVDKKFHKWDREDYSDVTVLGNIENGDLGDVISLGGELYAPCMISHKEDICFVEKFTLNDEAEETSNSDEFECPYCGSKQSDSWECQHEEEFEHECETCRGTYMCIASHSVDYNCEPIKRDVTITEV